MYCSVDHVWVKNVTQIYCHGYLGAIGNERADSLFEKAMLNSTMMKRNMVAGCS